MSQALHTSSTGINAGQSQINVISHNVANINTTAFKAANMVFDDLYSNNLSYGSAATKDGGGTNPKQIGVGVKVGGITRNFSSGTFVSTGRDLDCMISGTGFFVVQDGDDTYYTRDGIFSMDSEGNIVTQRGMKVRGAKSTYSNAGSSETLKVPKNMLATISGDPNLANKKLSELNNASITGGTVKYRVNGTDVTATIAQSDPSKTIGDLTVQEVVNMLNEPTGTTVFTISNGTIGYDSETFNVSFYSEGTTSKFVAETGLSNQNPSYILNQVVELKDVINYNDNDSMSVSNIAIDENGTLVATYNTGAVLTQYVDDADTVQWKYVTPEGVIITGSDVSATGGNIADSNFTLELATMVNQEGLVSVGNNLWQWGPNVGDIYYGVAGEMAFGPIESGGYEASNVDISSELSNMILAQRLIQMNSRVFSTASTVMETLAYLGS